MFCIVEDGQELVGQMRTRLALHLSDGQYGRLVVLQLGECRTGKIHSFQLFDVELLDEMLTSAGTSIRNSSWSGRTEPG